MPIKTGDKIRDALCLKMGENGPEEVALSSLVTGKKVVMFGLPGAYTGTCTTAHLPSFMRTAEAFREKGVDEIICISVNDPFVMDAWDKSTGAGEAGITMLAEPSSTYPGEIGLELHAPQAGLYHRLMRFSLYAEDGVIKVLNVEDNPGVCEISAGEALLDAI